MFLTFMDILGALLACLGQPVLRARPFTSTTSPVCDLESKTLGQALLSSMKPSSGFGKWVAADRILDVSLRGKIS